MAKPTDKTEAKWRNEYRWGKGKVNRRFRKKYGRHEAPPYMLRFYKRQMSRARRRALKNLDKGE